MLERSLFVSAVAATVILAGCGSGSGSAGTAANSVPNVASVARSAQAETTAAISPDAPKTLYLGFTHAALSKSKYGPLAYYSPTSPGATKILYVKSGAKVVFVNDDTTHHTASGLGTKGFPKSFDNTKGITRSGNTINGGLTWSTGNLNPGVPSQTFTIGPKGVYFFGCYYHYFISPSMRDVIVSQ